MGPRELTVTAVELGVQGPCDLGHDGFGGRLDGGPGHRIRSGRRRRRRPGRCRSPRLVEAVHCGEALTCAGHRFTWPAEVVIAFVSIAVADPLVLVGGVRSIRSGCASAVVCSALPMGSQ